MRTLTHQRGRIFGIRGRAAGATLALAFMLLATALATRSAQAQTYGESVLYTFTGGTDGSVPFSGLVRDAEGNLYGTTVFGGDLACSSGGTPGGCGVVFKLDTSGNETVLHSFKNTPDGAIPYAGLALDAKGNLYGTTYVGGTGGTGTIFRVSSGGGYTVLANGYGSYATPALDNQGNLYGIAGGGAYGWGTVFKLGRNGNVTTLYSFTGEADGGDPYGGVVLDGQGNIYGTTLQGGASGVGTVFKLDSSGSLAALSSFADGSGTPEANLVRDAQGDLYGTMIGGAYLYGTVFELSTTLQYSVLHSFNGSDGDWPGGLVRDSNGNLYGPTEAGGDPQCPDTPYENAGCGTVFRVDKQGKETTLYTFTGIGGDGANGSGVLSVDGQGNLYGTTSLGGIAGCVTQYGPYGCGTVFKLTLLTATKTTLTSSPNPSTHGQAVTFTAAVSSSKGAPPNGESVSFMQGTTVIGTGTLSSGAAVFMTSTLAVGTHSITAVYRGDSTFATSTSKPVKQVVNKATGGSGL
jgi:uncharacterized repeat protein (TIGR03803 family)